jgi:protein TonB
MVRESRSTRAFGPRLVVSLGLHLTILILLIVSIERRARQAQEEPPADYAMVFEGHSPERNSGPNPQQPHPTRPGSPAPTPTVPAIPPVPAAPPRTAALPPPPPPAPPAPEAPNPAPEPPHPSPPVPSPAAPSPSQAMVIPPLPPPQPRPAPLAPHPPVPTPPTRPRPEAPRRQAETPTQKPESGFPSPLAFSLGVPGRNAPQAAPSTRLAPASIPRQGRPGSIDLSFGDIPGGSQTPSSSVQMEGVAVSTDWLAEVTAWWQKHSYYPPQAGLNGEDGDVTLHMHVDHDGRVTQLELIGKSGSQWLDLGALSIFRDAYLPPLPSDMPEAQIPFHVTIHFIIVR